MVLFHKMHMSSTLISKLPQRIVMGGALVDLASFLSRGIFRTNSNNNV